MNNPLEHSASFVADEDLDPLRALLRSYRIAARNERDKGTYFERLAVAYMENDPIQVEQYEQVQAYGEWAKANRWDGRDTGIDLVAKLRHEDGYAAIQCKFYDPDHRVRKEDIDSFISASGKDPFERRVIIDTTETEWSENAEMMTSDLLSRLYNLKQMGPAFSRSDRQMPTVR